MNLQTNLPVLRSLLVSAALALMVVGATAQAAGSPSRASLRNDPVKVAGALYSAWKVKSRRDALQVAEPEAVDKLLGTRWRAMKFEGCNPRDEGGFQCVYRDKADDLSIAMEVDGGISVGGYNVVSVSFSTEG